MKIGQYCTIVKSIGNVLESERDPPIGVSGRLEKLPPRRSFPGAHRSLEIVPRSTPFLGDSAREHTVPKNSLFLARF